MKRDEFARRLREATQRSADECSRQLRRHVAPAVGFEVARTSYEGRVLTFDQVVDALYLGEDQSYAFIDVGHRVEDPAGGLGWVCPSGHRPRPYNEAWDPDGLGPFKAIGGIGRLGDLDVRKSSRLSATE